MSQIFRGTCRKYAIMLLATIINGKVSLLRCRAMTSNTYDACVARREVYLCCDYLASFGVAPFWRALLKALVWFRMRSEINPNNFGAS